MSLAGPSCLQQCSREDLKACLANQVILLRGGSSIKKTFQRSPRMYTDGFHSMLI